MAFWLVGESIAGSLGGNGKVTALKVGGVMMMTMMMHSRAVKVKKHNKSKNHNNNIMIIVIKLIIININIILFFMFMYILHGPFTSATGTNGDLGPLPTST